MSALGRINADGSGQKGTIARGNECTEEAEAGRASFQRRHYFGQHGGFKQRACH